MQEPEYAAAGATVVAAYRALPGHIVEPDYEAELADVGRRAALAEVAVAVAAEGVVVGCITYVPDATNAYAEFDDPDAAGFRMLGVDPGAAGRGAGRALVQWCIDRARAQNRVRIIIHSTSWMPRAHELYVGLGFERHPELDWQPLADVELLGFVLELR